MIQDNTRLHDFENLEGCFGNTRIMPTDIDGLVERNGKFLVIEFKPVGKQTPTGQVITLTRLAAIPGFTVIIVYHEPCGLHEHKHPVAMRVVGTQGETPINVGGLREFVSQWFRDAGRVV